MSLYRRGRTWWIELSSERGRVRESAGTADKRAAWEYHEKRKGELWRQEKLGEAAPVIWGRAVALWLKEKKRTEAERYMLLAFADWAAKPLPISTKDALDTIPDSSAGTFNRYLNIVVAVHNTAGAKAPEVNRRKPPPGRTRWLTAEEWERLEKALADESELLLHAARFTIATGLRENNVLGLEWGQVDMAKRRAWIHADQAKGGEPIPVPLNDGAMAVLKARRGMHKTYVFPNPDTGLPLYKASNRSWYDSLRKARLYKRIAGSKRLEVCWHTLRHTWASWHRMNGTPLEDIQDLGGWRDSKMVQRYAHLSADHLAGSAANVKPVSLRYNQRKRGSKDTKSHTTGA